MSERTPEGGRERRESPRVPMRFQIRREDGSDFQEHDGDLSLGGVAFLGSQELSGRYVIRLRLPGVEEELVALGEPVNKSGGDKVHLRFVDLETDTELAIAKYLDDLAGTAG